MRFADSQTRQECADWECVSRIRDTVCPIGHDSGYNSLRPLFFVRRYDRVVWWHDLEDCGLPLACQYTPPPINIVWRTYGMRGMLWLVRDIFAWLSSRMVRNVDAHLWA